MKHTKTIIAFLLTLLALTACHKDKEFDVKDAVVSNEEIMVLGTQARFSWKVDFEGHFQTGVEVSQNENMDEARRVDAAKEEDRFVAVVDSLPMGTKYYYRIVVWNKFGDSGQPVGDFTTSMSYTILVSAEPSDGGTATGGGTYAAGDTCTVMATAHVGYNFVNWTENGSQVSAEAEYPFAVTGNRDLVAHFTSQEYTITATAEPAGGGTVDGSGGYNHGDECTLTATANEGYTFINWTKDGTEISTNPVFTFTVTETATYVAHFQVQSYTITVASHPENGGIVEGGGTYEYGQTCTVKATEANGFTFVNWTENGGQVSSNTEYTFTVTGNRDLVANFTSQDYIIQVDIDPENGGTVTGAGGYNYGDQCTLTATPANGYSFVKWTENGEQVSGNATYTFTVTGSRNLVAHFQAEVYTITVSAEPSAGGTVYGDGDFHYGEPCTVTAIAETGYTFANWTEDGNIVSTQANYTFTVTSNRTLVAHFTQQQYTITATANPTNGGSVTGDGNFTYGQSCTLTATANTNFIFDNWTENGEVVSITPEYQFDVTNSRTLVANFTQTHTVTVSANPSDGGTATGGGTYSHGESCTVIATAADGYTFTNWTENGNVVSTDANYTFTVNSNRTLVANFSVQAPNTYNINVSPNPSNGGTVTGGGSYNQGASCTVTATANNGYTFTKWTENGNVVSTQASYTFTVNNSRTLVAQFQIQSYTISVSADPNSGGMVTGGNIYNYGQLCTVTATANIGYTFIQWTENGNQVSTDANYTFTVTSDHILVAQFQAQNYTIITSANPTNGGTAIISGNGTFTYGQSCTVTAYANNNIGYSFAYWTENDSIVSTEHSFTFQVTDNRTLVANFSYNGGGNVPQGAINGLFTINANGNQMYFSQGNLQYQASTQIWRFASYQFDYIGNDNSYISQTYNGWIDLFGWGTSGWNNGNVYYQPWDNQNNGINSHGHGYGPTDGTNYSYDLTGTYSHADWSVHNSIVNTSGQWRTLTKPEWDYVFNTRTTVSGIRYAKAQITGTNNGTVNGVILFPDNWNTSIYNPNLYNQPASFNSNPISINQWVILENAGAVFLPAAGYRIEISVSGVGSYGSYWSATSYYNVSAYHVRIEDYFVVPGSYGLGRYYGFSVRPVCPVQ